MQSSKEQQGEIRNSSSVINAKMERKTIKWEKLEISFKKIRDTKGTFHAKMGSIKDRNSMDLTEVDSIRKRWQKDLHGPDNHNGVITQLRAKHPGM